MVFNKTGHVETKSNIKSFCGARPKRSNNTSPKHCHPIEEWKPTIPSVIKIKRNDFVVSLKEYKDSATKDCKMRRCFLRTSHNRKKIPTPHASPTNSAPTPTRRSPSPSTAPTTGPLSPRQLRPKLAPFEKPGISMTAAWMPARPASAAPSPPPMSTPAPR